MKKSFFFLLIIFTSLQSKAQIFEEGRYRSITRPGDIITISFSYGYRWNSIDFGWSKFDSLTEKFQKEELYFYSDCFCHGSGDQMLKLDKKNSNVFRFINTNKLFLIRINNKSFKTADGSIWNFSSFFSEKEDDSYLLYYRNKADNSSTSYVNSPSQTVTIGKQVWMKKNLNVSTFRNGDSIPNAKTEGEWAAYNQAELPVWCYYNNDSSNGEKYGKLYNFYAVNDARGLAPIGFHIPSDQEWTILTDYLDDTGKGDKNKSKQGWKSNGNGTNSNLFLDLLGGFRTLNGEFEYLGYNGTWWSSTNGNNSYSFGIMPTFFNVNNNYKHHGFSVRCLKD